MPFRCLRGVKPPYMGRINLNNPINKVESKAFRHIISSPLKGSWIFPLITRMQHFLLCVIIALLFSRFFSICELYIVPTPFCIRLSIHSGPYSVYLFTVAGNQCLCSFIRFPYNSVNFHLFHFFSFSYNWHWKISRRYILSSGTLMKEVKQAIKERLCPTIATGKDKDI